jgi:CheY-like chemotaxis protein
MRRQVLRERLESWGLLVEEAVTDEAARTAVLQRALRPAVALVATDSVPGWMAFGRWLASVGPERLCMVALAPFTALPDAPDTAAAGFASALPHCVQHAKLRELLRNACSPDPTPAARTHEPTDECPWRCRILMAGMSSTDRSRIASLLEARGCRVGLPESARETLDLLRTQAQDVVLIDLSAGAEDGFELAGQIREWRPGARMAVVGLTDQVTPEVRSGARDAGFTAIAAKPLEQAFSAGACWWASLEQLEDCYDRVAALRNCGGDPDMLTRLAHQLRSSVPKFIADLRNAAGRHEETGLLATVQQVHSAAALFAAAPLAADCDELTAAAERMEWAALPGYVDAVRFQLFRLLGQLYALENSQ